MPQFKTGDMFHDYPTKGVCYIATTNGVVKKDGTLVMGKGNALALARLEPWLPKKMGEVVLKQPIYWVRIFRGPNHWVGVFQSKEDWKQPSRLELIEESARTLHVFAEIAKDITFYLPFPGIGNGGLQRGMVLPFLKDLPNNVIIWEK